VWTPSFAGGKAEGCGVSEEDEMAELMAMMEEEDLAAFVEEHADEFAEADAAPEDDGHTSAPASDTMAAGASELTADAPAWTPSFA
jgi:hypothetical protein